MDENASFFVQVETTFLLPKELSLELNQHSMFMVLPSSWPYRLMQLLTQETVEGLQSWVTRLLEWLFKTFQVQKTLGEFYVAINLFLTSCSHCNKDVRYFKFGREDKTFPNNHENEYHKFVFLLITVFSESWCE